MTCDVRLIVHTHGSLRKNGGVRIVVYMNVFVVFVYLPCLAGRRFRRCLCLRPSLTRECKQKQNKHDDFQAVRVVHKMLKGRSDRTCFDGVALPSVSIVRYARRSRSSSSSVSSSSASSSSGCGWESRADGTLSGMESDH